jgi:hypothetical protein
MEIMSEARISNSFCLDLRDSQNYDKRYIFKCQYKKHKETSKEWKGQAFNKSENWRKDKKYAMNGDLTAISLMRIFCDIKVH